MLKVKLREEDKELIREVFGFEGRIQYKQALASINSSSSGSNWEEEPWIVRNPKTEDYRTTVSIKDFLESRLDAASSYQSTRFSSNVTKSSKPGTSRSKIGGRMSRKRNQEDPFMNVIKEEVNETSKLENIEKPCKIVVMN